MINTIRRLARRVRRTASGDVINKPVMFLHVPKCGGTSIQVALQEAYGLRSGIRIDLRGTIHHNASFRLNSHASKDAADRLGMPLHELREHVLLYHMSESKAKFISGHFCFSNAAYEGFKTEYNWITLIRDPVARWYSHYFYNRDKKGDHFAVDDTIDNYLRSSTAQSTGSLIARFLAGTDCKENHIVEHAIENIAKFDVVGVLENLGTFKRDLKRVLGANIDIPVRNTSPTPASQKHKEITPDIHRQVVDLCKPDQEVYDYVIERYMIT